MSECGGSHHRYSGDSCPCIICNFKFYFRSDNWRENMLSHLYFVHKIIIDNTAIIADITEYMKYYRTQHLEGRPLQNMAQKIIAKHPRRRDSTIFYLFGDFIPEDDFLRRNIHKKALESAKIQQQKDLSGQLYKKHCFYCNQTYKTTRTQFVEHLRSEGFILGKPRKMVYIEEFVNVIEEIFQSRCCLFCGKNFLSFKILKDHMRQKGHMKINPDSHFFDQFYMINYLEYGKSWMDYHDSRQQKNDDEDGGALESPIICTESEQIMCLFCKHVCRTWDGTLLHMKIFHGFDFENEISELSVLDQFKAITYIRDRVASIKCVICEEGFDQSEKLLDHMEKNDHYHIPKDRALWYDSRYLNPALDDCFFYHLKDDKDSSNGTLEQDSQNEELESFDTDVIKNAEEDVLVKENENDLEVKSKSVVLPTGKEDNVSSGGHFGDSNLPTGKEENVSLGGNFGDSTLPTIAADKDNIGSGTLLDWNSKSSKESELEFQKELKILKEMNIADDKNGAERSAGIGNIIKESRIVGEALVALAEGISSDFGKNKILKEDITSEDISKKGKALCSVDNILDGMSRMEDCSKGDKLQDLSGSATLIPHSDKENTSTD